MLDASILNAVAEAEPIVREPVQPILGRVAHVDGDMIAYMAGGNDDTSIATSRAMMSGKLNSILSHSGAMLIVMHLTASGCLKGNRPLYAVTQPYQLHRKGKAKPKNFQYLRDYMELYEGPQFVTKIWYDREADDGMALAGSNGQDNVICSGDKDMLASPGWHCDWTTYEMVYVPEDTYCMPHSDPDKCYGYKWFLMQMLHGDDADAIPGLGKGYGPAFAKSVLDKTDNAYDGCMAVIGEYTKKFGADAAALKLVEMATLLWIRRGKAAEDYEWYDYWPVKHPRIEAAMAEAKIPVLEYLAEANAIMNGDWSSESDQ